MRLLNAQAEVPEQAVQNEITAARIIGQAEGAPKQTDRQQCGKRGVPYPFEGYKDSAGKHSPEPAGHGSRGSISDSQCHIKKRPADERPKQAIEEGSQIQSNRSEAAQ